MDRNVMEFADLDVAKWFKALDRFEGDFMPKGREQPQAQERRFRLPLTPRPLAGEKKSSPQPAPGPSPGGARVPPFEAAFGPVPDWRRQRHQVQARPPPRRTPFR